MKHLQLALMVTICVSCASHPFLSSSQGEATVDDKNQIIVILGAENDGMGININKYLKDPLPDNTHQISVFLSCGSCSLELFQRRAIKAARSGREILVVSPESLASLRTAKALANNQAQARIRVLRQTSRFSQKLNYPSDGRRFVLKPNTDVISYAETGNVSLDAQGGISE